MFSIGFFEIIVIFLVVCLVIAPKKIPYIVKDIRLYYRKFMKIRDEIAGIIKDINLEENDDREKKIKKSTKHLLGDDGSLYEAYDVSEIIKKDTEKVDGD